jgi:hypothetical protein
VLHEHPDPHLNEAAGEREMRMSTSTTAKRERPKPRYIARAKVNGGWQNIGAAWNFRSGEEGLSIQLNTLPINFDGRFVLLEPLPNGEAPEAPQE